MRFLFVISASIWSWLVSRCIAFGPNINGIFWRPCVDADTWYRLTPIPAKLPGTILKHMPIILLIISIPLLYIKNNFIHAFTVVMLVSEHAIIPIFMAQLHDNSKIIVWAFLNTVVSILYVLMVFPTVWSIFCIMKTTLNLWILYIQIYITFFQPIIREIEYQKRTPRIV